MLTAVSKSRSASSTKTKLFLCDAAMRRHAVRAVRLSCEESSSLQGTAHAFICSSLARVWAKLVLPVPGAP